VKRKKNFNSLGEASELLGEDFWEVITDVLPFIGPRIDVIRSTSEMIIIAEIPGILSQSDISIKLQGSMLWIEGQIQRPYMDADYKILQDERFNGVFKRKVRLQEDCIHEKMAANYANGLLEIRMPTFGDENNYSKTNVPIRFSDDNPID
jgi:HSP20 family protein